MNISRTYVVSRQLNQIAGIVEPVNLSAFSYKMKDKFWKVRTYRPADFENYVRLCLDTKQQDQSDEPVSEQLIAEALGHPSFQPEKNLLLAEAEQKLVGCVSVFPEPAIGRALLEGLVHPQYRRKGIATDLLRQGLRHAGNAGADVAQICIAETNLAAKTLLTGMGLEFFRHFIGFKLDLTEIQLPDITPGDYVFRRLQPGEEQVLTDIQNRSFADTWGFNANTSKEIAHRINSVACKPADIIMVYQAQKPVAYCWTRIFPTSGSTRGPKKGEIHMLGVDPDFRKQSIGSRVLTAGLAHLEHRGVKIVELMADGEMPAALALYDSAGFKRCMRAEWYQKKL